MKKKKGGISNYSVLTALIILFFTIGVAMLFTAAPDRGEDLELINAFYEDLINAPTEEVAQQNATVVFSENWVVHPISPIDDTPEKWVTKIFGFKQLIPDMKWEVVKIIPGDNGYYTVVGKGTGTPNGEFLGIQTDGTKSFEVDSIDIHRIVNGKIVETRHIEDWATAIGQLTE